MQQVGMGGDRDATGVVGLGEDGDGDICLTWGEGHQGSVVMQTGFSEAIVTLEDEER